jgi:hypothetical protein
MKEMKRMRKEVKDRGWQNFFHSIGKMAKGINQKGSLRA